MSTWPTILTFVLGLLLSCAAGAAAIAEDDFETASTGDLNGQNTGSGWGGAWGASSTVETVIDTTASPLSFNVSGGAMIDGGTRAVQLDGDNADALSRAIASQDGDVIYFRFLFRLDAGSVANNDFLSFWFEDGTGGAGHTTGVPNIGVKGNNGDGSGTEDFFSRLNLGDESYSTNINQGQTYLVVGWLNKSVSGAGNNWDSFALWVDPAFADAGSPDVTATGGDDASNFDGFGVRTANFDGDDEFTIDELVVGTTWNDVVSEPGTITIVKQTDPDGAPGSFGFTRSYGGPFNLGDDGTISTAGLDAPMQYTVTEDDPTPGFDLTGLVCTDSDAGGTASSGNTGTRTATINLDPGETVTCTFTDTQRGTVNISKATNPAGGTGFTFSSDLPGGGFGLDDGQTHTENSVVPGTYAVTEDDPTPLGFDLTSIDCTDSDSGGTDSSGSVGTRTATINLDPGETVICTFANGISDVDLAVDKQCQPDPPQSRCLISVSNLGPGTAINVVVTDPVPDGLVWNSDSCSAGPPVGGVLSWDVGTLAAGEGAACQVVFDIQPGAAGVFNTAFVNSDNPDGNPDNNAAEAAAVSAMIPALGEAGRVLLAAVLLAAGLLSVRRRFA